MRTTREELVKINAQMQSKITKLENSDLFIRQKITNILYKYVEPHNSYQAYSSEKEPKPISWEEIFFRFGELNSDANYTILLGEKIRIEGELKFLEEKNREEKKI